jgi:ParB/RepB/Spo0J family partition protein
MDEGALYELAESIKAQGIMQPILVRRLVDGANAGKYEIIAGERRFAPAQTGWTGQRAGAGARRAGPGRGGHGADREHAA